jgi:hypothetical protein
MAIDRAGARRRVKTITAWAAGGAAALTAAFAFGASRGNHVAKATATPIPNGTSEDATPQSSDPGTYLQDPQNGYSQGNQGFTPPSSSTAPPSGMSGGS